jgi:hypothetical protein
LLDEASCYLAIGARSRVLVESFDRVDHFAGGGWSDGSVAVGVGFHGVTLVVRDEVDGLESSAEL